MYSLSKFRHKLLAAGFASSLLLLSLGSSASASPAASTPPTPSTEPGIIHICPGNSIKTTDALGRPLPTEEVALMKSSVQEICTPSKFRPAVPFSSAAVSHYGYATAHAVASGAWVTLSATANSIGPAGYQRSLSCMYQQKYPYQSTFSGAWISCGVAGGSGTYLSTRNDQFCPAAPTMYKVRAALLGPNGSPLIDEDTVIVTSN